MHNVTTSVMRAIVNDGLHLGSGFDGNQMRLVMCQLTVFLGFDPVL